MRASVNVKTVQKRLEFFEKSVAERVHQVVDARFIEAEGYAKEKAPWTDRTGDARRSITYADLSDEQTLRFYLYIGMWYGVFLELANQGKYRILLPTFTIFENEIYKDLRKMGLQVK